METTSLKPESTGKNYIVFFDLDRTIISANSGKVLVRAAYDKGLMSLPEMIRAVWLSFLYRFELQDTVRIIDSMAGWLKGKRETDLTDLTSEIFSKYILKAIRPEIVEEITYHRKEGARLVILSSALLAVCKPVAEYLKMDDIICSGLEVNNGIFTGHPAGPFCFGTEKVKRLNEYCTSIKISPSDSWYYGDSIADLPVLGSVGYPVCVAPDKKLLRTAREKGWKVIKSL